MALQTQSGAQKFAEKLQLHEAAYCELERARYCELTHALQNKAAVTAAQRATAVAPASLPPPLPPPSPPLLPMDEGDGTAQGQGPGPLPPPEAVPMAGAVELAPVDPPAHTCASDRHRQRLAVQAVPPESDAATDRRTAGRAKGGSERACEGEPAEKKAAHSGSRGCAAAGCSF